MRARKVFASLLLAALWSAAAVPAFAAPSRQFTETDRAEVEDVFLRQAAAATAHDIVAFEQILVPVSPGRPDPVVMVARAYQFWGKEALIDHFKETFKGIWKFEPDVPRIKIIPLTPDVAQIYARTQITLGAASSSARTAPFLVYEVAVRTPAGWRIASIVPVPTR